MTSETVPVEGALDPRGLTEETFSFVKQDYLP